MKKIKIAILGLGNVGGGVYKILKDDKKSIMHRDNVDIDVKYILVRDKNKSRDLDVNPDLFIEDFETILNDSEVDIVAEFMGGIDPAKEYVLSSLRKGKTVVTANKELVAKYWPDLNSTAKENNAGLFFEPSVAGGIPVLKTLWDSMQGNNIESIYGIINGTTNYILSRMSDEGKPYEEILKDAQSLGFAEADPSSDVDGYDAMYKLSILSSMAFHAKVPVDCIHIEGITAISSEDIEYAKELGYSIKLLAIGKKHEKTIEARVHPTMIKSSHPLASVSGAYNAVFIKGSAVGGLMLYGQGAGRMPTASAAVSDIISACNHKNFKYTTFVNKYKLPKDVKFQNNWECGYYIRILAKDQPGALSEISGVFGENGVSIASVIQTGDRGGVVPIRIITHLAREINVNKAIEDLKYTKCVVDIGSIIRVEDNI